MEFVFGALALLFVLFVVYGCVLTVRAVRAMRRGVERTGAQVRRTVEETTLKARAAQPGAVGEVARVRLGLRSSVDNTRRALELGVAEDPSLRESLALLDQLHEHARQLDRELRVLMEREPDRARIADRLPAARERADRIRESADSLRFAAQERASQHGADGLDALREQIQMESVALRHWEKPTTGGEPDDHTTRPASSGGPAPGAAAEAPATEGAEPRPAELGDRRRNGAGADGARWIDDLSLGGARSDSRSDPHGTS
ncbi:hypothetical protein [Streptomyces sp. AJS327]|uniref:hypothetical protein n=1 Tax=Streptomyces sp. AJS327 TaxID=2545265 RepID=UPI0015DF0C24|nr:hypothetical protein [Streptomyces sp. AJS327]